MARNARALERSWGALLPTHTPGARHRLSSCLDEPGGFKILRAEEPELGPTARAFFATAGHRSERFLHFRGYAYYSADPAMHLATCKPRLTKSLSDIEERICSYVELLEILSEAHDSAPFSCRWLAAVSLLEWIANDLFSLHWLAVALERQGAAHGAARQLEWAGQSCCELLARLSFGSWRYGQRWDAAAARARLGEILGASRALPWKAWRGALARPVGLGTLRAIREGDQLWLSMAAFERKVARLLGGLAPDERCLIVSNAFGAIHVGGLWHALLTSEQLRERVELATVCHSIHEAEMNRSRTTPVFSSSSADASLIVHADDSVFTGRTHDQVRASFPNSKVVLVPLTFDVGTVYNHPEELGADPASVEKRFVVVERMAREGDGQLPPARSYWAINKVARVPVSVRRPEEWLRIVNGSDRLHGMLWQRFARDICGEQ